MKLIQQVAKVCRLCGTPIVHLIYCSIRHLTTCRLKAGSAHGTRLGAALLLVILLGSCSDSWRVTRVVDGDTLWVKRGLRKEKVRLKGVDAPEIPHPEMGRFRDDPYGRESKACLIGMLHGRTVRLESAAPAGTPERDKYGRLLAYVHAGGVNVNAELIRRGCARAFRKFEHPKKQEFLVLEKEARRQGMGLWAGDKHRSAPAFIRPE